MSLIEKIRIALFDAANYWKAGLCLLKIVD